MIGAILGALLIAFVAKTFLMVLFSFILFFSAYFTLKRNEEHDRYTHSHPWAVKLNLNEGQTYHIQHAPLGIVMTGISGIISGLLGIGSGALNVLAMDQILKMPYKTAAATSNFMIGITATASAGIYFSRGYIHPTIVFPVMIGVVAGAFVGAKLLKKIPTHTLRIIFSIVILIMGLQMLYKAFFGAL